MFFTDGVVFSVSFDSSLTGVSVLVGFCSCVLSSLGCSTTGCSGCCSFVIDFFNCAILIHPVSVSLSILHQSFIVSNTFTLPLILVTLLEFISGIAFISVSCSKVY